MCDHPVHFKGTALAALLTCSIAACGGSEVEAPFGDAPALTRMDAVRAAPLQVQVEACVTDQYELPRSGSLVRLLSADGRLLGHAVSDRDGILRARVSPNQTVRLVLERDEAQHIDVRVAESNLSIGACLRERDGS